MQYEDDTLNRFPHYRWVSLVSSVTQVQLCLAGREAASSGFCGACGTSKARCCLPRTSDLANFCGVCGSQIEMSWAASCRRFSINHEGTASIWTAWEFRLSEKLTGEISRRQHSCVCKMPETALFSRVLLFTFIGNKTKQSKNQRTTDWPTALGALSSLILEGA